MPNRMIRPERPHDICAFGHLFQHPVGEPFVMHHESTEPGCVHETPAVDALAAYAMPELRLLLGTPGMDTGEVGRLQHRETIYPFKERSIRTCELGIYIAAPDPVRIFLAFQGIDGLGQLPLRFRQSGQAPALEQDHVARTLHRKPFGRPVVEGLIETGKANRSTIE